MSGAEKKLKRIGKCVSDLEKDLVDHLRNEIEQIDRQTDDLRLSSSQSIQSEHIQQLVYFISMKQSL